jgi:hypothetical protein
MLLLEVIMPFHRFPTLLNLYSFKKTFRIAFNLTDFIIFVLLAGCSIIPKYPANMPPLEPVDTSLNSCPVIAGKYSDKGNVFTPEGNNVGTVSLTRLLHPELSSSQTVDDIIINGPQNGVVEIKSYANNSPLAVWSQHEVTKEAYLSKGDSVVGETYLCQDGYVRIGRKYNVLLSPIALSVKSNFLWLRRATDCSLIILHTDYDTHLLQLVVPIANTNKLWYRFTNIQ